MIYLSCNLDIYFFDKTSHFFDTWKNLTSESFLQVFSNFQPLLCSTSCDVYLSFVLYLGKWSSQNLKKKLKKLLIWFFENYVVIRQVLCSIFNICYSISFINKSNAWVWLDPYMMIPPDCRVIWTSTTYTLYKSLPFWKWWGLKVMFWKKYII